MASEAAIVVTGMGLEIPGWDDRPAIDILEGPVAYGEFEPRSILGKKGLRYKDRATLLALCAAHKALDDRGLLTSEPSERADIGVCVSSNLGNMDTVCNESAVIRSEHVDSTSPMSLPVASSNVIAASIAIRFGCKGVNLMLCNGATSGIDALHIAMQMLASGRAGKMLVVGVEPRNAITDKMLETCDPESRHGEGVEPGELAAALLLERADDAVETIRYGTLADYRFVPSGADMPSSSTRQDAWFIPSQTTERAQALVRVAGANGLSGIPTIDVTRHTGELYGALGVLQVLLALSHLKASGGGRALVSNGLTFGDGLSSMQVEI